MSRWLWLAVSLALLALTVALPLEWLGEAAVPLIGEGTPFLLAGVAAVALIVFGWLRSGRLPAAASLLAATVIVAWMAMQQVAPTAGQPVHAGGGAVALVVLLFVLTLGACATLSQPRIDRSGVVAPILFFVLILYLWQLATIVLAISPVLLPAPTAVVEEIVKQRLTLREDFIQTVIRAAIPGYVLGSAAGIALALAVDRFTRLRASLNIFGSFLSVVPILGVAPVMVLWFGFDWQSKVAVVVLMTFFPAFVSTNAGLAATGAIESDLMNSYAATYRQTLLKVRLPNALPYIFTALKLNVPTAMIGAMVAEFFGTPVVGLGFRIASEVGRLSLDVVWAAIVVTSGFSLLLYGAVALVDRFVTFWDPSHRR